LADKIVLTGVHLQCRLGVPAEERASAQEILVDIEMRMDLAKPGRTDEFADTVDYAAVRDLLQEVATRRDYLLVEAVAESMAHEVLAHFPIPEVCLTVWKPGALRAFNVDNTSIQIVRRRA
jgi:dihydroneopterin aldolase